MSKIPNKLNETHICFMFISETKMFSLPPQTILSLPLPTFPTL